MTISTETRDKVILSGIFAAQSALITYGITENAALTAAVSAVLGAIPWVADSRIKDAPPQP